MLKLRPIGPNDKELLEKWINCDEDHSGKTDVNFWLPQERTNCFAVEDEVGTIFYVRAENVLRLHCQFAPGYEIDRTRAAIDEFAEMIKNNAKENYRQIIFESVFKPLIRFLHKRGYRSSPNEHIIDI